MCYFFDFNIILVYNICYGDDIMGLLKNLFDYETKELKKINKIVDEIEALGGVDMLMAAKVIKRKGKRVHKYDFQLGKYDWNKIPENIKALIRTKRDGIIDSQGKEIILSFRIIPV